MDPERRGNRLRRPVFRRVARAARLDPFLYDSVAADASLTREAVSVAVVSSLVMGLGLMLVRTITPFWWLVGSIGWATGVLALGSWFFVAVGRRVGRRVRYDEMVRALGYAMAPQALGFIPIAWFIPGFIAGGVWVALCVVVAVREVLDVPTRLAAIMVIAPMLMMVGTLPLIVAATRSTA
jgi:hypothetical protein